MSLLMTNWLLTYISISYLIIICIRNFPNIYLNLLQIKPHEVQCKSNH